MRGADALIIMAKVPRPGTVKTRLVPFLSARAAAALHACMLADAAEEMASLSGVRRYLFLAPAAGRAGFGAAPYADYAVRPQSAGDLGERMARAAAAAFRDGASRVAVIGADCPALRASRVRQAFREISAGASIVLGPSADGGFHLAAFAAPAPSVFRGIAWGTGSVLAATAARCRDAGLSYALLRVERDVDTADDVEAFRRWARDHARPRCRRTRLFVSGLRGRSSRCRPAGRGPVPRRGPPPPP
ncbi:MAG: TIGR04282 family arsenosugar biosynthesis glycosyltransferase [Gemmatimonadota bacterium]